MKTRRIHIGLLSDNDPSICCFGFEVADEIQSWIKMGICVGPMPASELPFMDLTTRVKPNGHVRLILDQSYPHNSDVKLGMGIPYSVNKGIEKDKYKTKMSSTPYG